MKFIDTGFEGLYEIHLEKKGDDRGWFMRTFDQNLFKVNIPSFSGKWMQMNHSFSSEKYTWRGFHFQKEPYQETKLVRCIRGSVLDCVLDLRETSGTFLKVFQIELSLENNKMLFIPKGFAHGFLSLEDNSELIYLHDEFYQPEFEDGVRFDDIKIKFQLPVYPKVISDRDKKHKAL
jgi:dTDP-4-dehydrorhamnose 3,5-epimerase